MLVGECMGVPAAAVAAAVSEILYYLYCLLFHATKRAPIEFSRDGGVITKYYTAHTHYTYMKKSGDFGTNY